MTNNDIGDEELEDLLIKAGITAGELQAYRAVYPEAKVTLWAIQQFVAKQVAKALVKEMFPVQQ